MHKDSDGNLPTFVVGALIGGGISAAITLADEIISNGNLKDINWCKVAISGATGAISGGLAASGAPLVAQRVVSATTSIVDSISQSVYDKEAIGKAAVKAAISGGKVVDYAN